MKITFLKMIIPILTGSVISLSSDAQVAFEVNGKYGLKNESGKVIAPAKYNSLDGYAFKFVNGFSRVNITDANGQPKYGFIDKNGKEITAIKYDYVWNFSEGMARVAIKNEKGSYFQLFDSTKVVSGFINNGGIEVIAVKYYDAADFSEGLCAVTVDSSGYTKTGFMDKTGTMIIWPQYIKASSFVDGVAVVGVDSQVTSMGGRLIKLPMYGFIDKAGKHLSEIKYTSIGDFNNGLANFSIYAENKLMFGYIDKKLSIAIAPKYNYADVFYDGLAKVGLLDAKGEAKYGFIDNTGTVVIPVIYKEVNFFSEGLACVKGVNNKYGFIDKTGKVVIKLKYNSVRSPSRFEDGGVIVSEKGGPTYRINRQGKEWPY